MCVDLAKQSKPIIYINNAYTNFNITGSFTVKNIKFSGINALAHTSNKEYSGVDLSVYPDLFCSMASDPQG